MPREDTQFTKGQPRHPNAGRKKGTPNKRSTDINDALGLFIMQQMPSMYEMFERVKESESDLKGFNALTRLIAIHLRKAPPQTNQNDDTDETDASLPLPALYLAASERQAMMRAIRKTDMAPTNPLGEYGVSDALYDDIQREIAEIEKWGWDDEKGEFINPPHRINDGDINDTAPNPDEDNGETWL